MQVEKVDQNAEAIHKLSRDFYEAVELQARFVKKVNEEIERAFKALNMIGECSLLLNEKVREIYQKVEKLEEKLNGPR